MAGTIIGFIIGALVFGAIIWTVARLGLGITLESYWWGVTLGILISLFSSAVSGFFPNAGMIASALVAMIVSALVIYVAGMRLKGIQVNGFRGAVIAAISIGVVQFVILWLVGLAV